MFYCVYLYVSLSLFVCFIVSFCMFYCVYLYILLSLFVCLSCLGNYLSSGHVRYSGEKGLIGC